MRRAEAFRDGGREVRQRAAPLSITAKTTSPDRRQSPIGLPLRIDLWPNAKFSSRVPRESGNGTLSRCNGGSYGQEGEEIQEKASGKE